MVKIQSISEFSNLLQFQHNGQLSTHALARLPTHKDQRERERGHKIVVCNWLPVYIAMFYNVIWLCGILGLLMCPFL